MKTKSNCLCYCHLKEHGGKYTLYPCSHCSKESVKECKCIRYCYTKQEWRVNKSCECQPISHASLPFLNFNKTVSPSVSGWEDIGRILKETKENKIFLAMGVYIIKCFLSSELLKQRQEWREKMEKIFDDCRSSNEKDKSGKRRFGIPKNIRINVKYIYERFLEELEG